MTGDLRLRPLQAGDEAAAVAGHEAMASEDFAFLLGYEAGDDWARYLDRLRRRSRALDLPGDTVAATFLAATVDGELVGRASIRHGLNDFLAAQGGHIGYAVLPGHRRRGHAAEILRQAVIVARSLGVDRLLLICDDTNVASARAIERNGGGLEAVVQPGPGVPLRRYWIG